MVGRDSESKPAVWGYNGNTWAKLSDGNNSNQLPAFTHTALLNYNEQIYAWGSGFEQIYQSNSEGFSWSKAPAKFAFPVVDGKAAFQGREHFSIVHDPATDYIYLLFGNDSGKESQVWRGRLNKLWFLHSR